jgi:hypothetical protein
MLPVLLTRAGRRLVLASLVVALLWVQDAEAGSTHESGRYQFGTAPDGAIFVLDSASGRVWRYDRSEDAWYLYDLEALVKVPGEKGVRSRAPAPTPTPSAEPPRGEPGQEDEVEPDHRPGDR